MTKRRAVLGIVLDLILLFTILWVVIRNYDFSTTNSIIDYVKLGEYLCPMVLGVVTFLHILALLHSLNSGKKANSFISALMLIAVSTEMVIMIIRLALVMPYRHSFDIYGIDYELFIVIPVLAFISFLPSNHKYSAWGLLYSNLGLIGYFGTIITLNKLNIIESPYKFTSIDDQKIYKLIINMATVVAMNTFVSGVLMLISRPKAIDNK